MEHIHGRIDADQWWRSAVIYQVYPRSFADSNNDGVGDIPGITSKLDYLGHLGVDAIWISPFYPSPQLDGGYDVADYFNVNPQYGTLDDVTELISQAHRLSIRVIIDVVPNHSSWEHPWFKDALGVGPGSPERDRYIFRHSVEQPPNNWGGMFGGSAWEPVQPHSGRADDKDWWYLHLFDVSQPDFNWDNPDVHDHFKRYLRFWCDLGVDGFRVDVADSLVKKPGLPNDRVGPDRFHPIDTGSYPTNALPYYDQDGVHDIYREWRQVLDEYGPDRMMVAEAWLNPPERVALYVREDELSQAFNFDYLRAGWFPGKIRQIIDMSLRVNGEVGAPVTWVLSNHDVVRHATRFGFEPGQIHEGGVGPADPQPDRALGQERALAASLFMLALPGSAYLYQGEELGLPEHTTIPDESRKDPTFFRTNGQVVGRDGCRVPLPWRAGQPHSGFSAAEPWLPQPDFWDDFAPDVEDANPDSTLNLYRTALRMRRMSDLGNGELKWVSDPDCEALVLTNRGITVALNMGDTELTLSGTVMLATRTVTVGSDDQCVVVPPNSACWLA